MKVFESKNMSPTFYLPKSLSVVESKGLGLVCKKTRGPHWVEVKGCYSATADYQEVKLISSASMIFEIASASFVI